VAWFFRARHAESWIFRGAVVVLVAVHGANWVFKYSGPVWGIPGSVEIGTGGTIPDGILWGLSGVCALLMVGSAWWAWKRYLGEQQRLSRKSGVAVLLATACLCDAQGGPTLPWAGVSLSVSR
jgi:hypothetical protein